MVMITAVTEAPRCQAAGAGELVGIPGATRLSAAEQATAARLRRLAGFSGLTFRESPHVGAEYVDELGRSYDALGTPRAAAYWNKHQFLASIGQHLLKSNDFTVVDASGFRPHHVAAVRDYLDSLPTHVQARVVRIEF